VQEALLRVHQALQAGEEIASPRASLLQSKVHDTLRLVEGKEI
jgi:DNA-directed RNA polymerase specialized sigma24 family protein